MTYQAIYKCRLCREEFVGTLLDEDEVDMVFESFWKGNYRCKLKSGRNDVPKETFHCCIKDSISQIGIADFQGFKAVEE